MSKSVAIHAAPRFEERIKAARAQLSPAETRIARYFADNKEAALLSSAAQIAQQAGTSDATVVRTAQALGFDGLSALREALLVELTGTLPTSPGGRLKRSLDEADRNPDRALTYVVAQHEEALKSLQRDDLRAAFNRALPILAKAKRRFVFGIGPSGAVADYAALQFNRIGLAALAMTASGIGLADRLMWLAPGDAVLVLAYAPLYREVSVVLEQARALDVPVVLVSDSLGSLVTDDATEVLQVPRGRAGHLAMHGATLVLIEAIVMGLAAFQADNAFEQLERLNGLRGSIDKAWLKRGMRRPKS